MPSPIFQDVFYFGASGSKKVEVGVQPSPPVKLPIDFSANAIRTFFAILEGRKIREIDFSNGTDETNVDCTASLMEANALGDKYDVPFFRGAWRSAILDLAEEGGEHALMAFSAACSAGDKTLAKVTIKKCKGNFNPCRYPASQVERIGWKSWLRIIGAWDNLRIRDSVTYFDHNKHWERLGEYLQFEDPASSKAIHSRN